jgi:hypothetical protein
MGRQFPFARAAAVIGPCATTKASFGVPRIPRPAANCANVSSRQELTFSAETREAAVSLNRYFAVAAPKASLGSNSRYHTALDGGDHA